jgi:CBS domain-containing protein
MSIRDAMTDKFMTLSPDDGVGDAIKAMRGLGIDMAPVVDTEDRVQGIFSLSVLLRNLLPVSVTMAGGVQLDVRIPAAPGIGKRLQRAMDMSVGEVMDRKVTGIDPQTPLWEAINALTTHGSPLMVVDSASGKIAGVITSQSVLDFMQRSEQA